MSLGVIIIIYLAFLLSTPIHIWPELYLLPWIVTKGLVPYRDFFDHHGFLLYYVLALVPGNALYIVTQLLNTFLVYSILRTSIFFTLFFVLVSVFTSENFLWYEGIITTLYLVSYLVLTRKPFVHKRIFLGFLVGLASFIKPTAAIVLLPIIVYEKTLIPLLIAAIMWIVVFAMCWIIGGISSLVTDLFVFNQFLFTYYEGFPVGDKRILLLSTCMIILCIYAAIRSKIIRLVLLPFSYMLVSLVFLRLAYGKEHLVPLATFFVLFIATTFAHTSRRYKIFLTIGLLVLSLALVRQINYRYTIIRTERIQTARNATLANVAQFLNQQEYRKKKFYVFGDLYELYLLRDQLPPTYFPIRFPLLERFFPDFEERIIEELKQKKVDYIIIPQPLPKNFQNLTIIQAYIKNNYEEVNGVSSVKIYKKN